MKNYIDIVKDNVSIKEGVRGIEQFLIELFFNSPQSSKALAQKLLLPIPLVTALKKEFKKLAIVKQDRGIAITELGKQYVKDVMGFEGIDKKLYMDIKRDEDSVKRLIDKGIEELEDIFASRPDADRSIDQAHCTVETSIKRALLTVKHDSLANKRILCVGDDDLVSIALAWLLKELYPTSSYLTTSIHVLDIDQRYLEYIDAVGVKYDMPISTQYCDLKAVDSVESLKDVDAVFTDPPYTKNGMNLFLSRAISTMKPQCGLPVFLSYAHKSTDEMLEVGKVFNDLGLTVQSIVKRFNVYEGAGVIGNMGQMIVLQTTSLTPSKLKMKDHHAIPIYTREVRMAEKR